MKKILIAGLLALLCGTQVPNVQAGGIGDLGKKAEKHIRRTVAEREKEGRGSLAKAEKRGRAAAAKAEERGRAAGAKWEKKLRKAIKKL